MPLTHTDVQRHERALTDALGTLETGRTRLHQPDGARIFSDAEHERREAELLAAFDRTVEPIREAGFTELGALDLEEQTLDSDPLERLTADELARANALRPFLQEDAQLLPVPELQRQAERYRLAGDRVRLVLLQRYTGQRLEALQAAHDPAQRTQRVALEALMQALVADVADPKRGDTLKALEERRARAQRLRKVAGEAHARGHQLQERMRAELRASGRYSVL